MEKKDVILMTTFVNNWIDRNSQGEREGDIKNVIKLMREFINFKQNNSLKSICFTGDPVREECNPSSFNCNRCRDIAFKETTKRLNELFGENLFSENDYNVGFIPMFTFDGMPDTITSCG